jgi:hypothetical protein
MSDYYIDSQGNVIDVWLWQSDLGPVVLTEEDLGDMILFDGMEKELTDEEEK